VLCVAFAAVMAGSITPGKILRETPESAHCCGRRAFHLYTSSAILNAPKSKKTVERLLHEVLVQLFEPHQPSRNILFTGVIDLK
jgi:hypothetical protein